jgi:hypothetical protein
MSQVSQTGNTKPVCRFQLYCWTFTLKADTLSVEQLVSQLNHIAKKWTFQEERGNESDYLHYQGVFSLKNKEYFQTVKNLFPSSIHLEPCQNWWASVVYCTKTETRTRGPFFFGQPLIKTITTLYSWQLDCMDLMRGPVDDRKIYWLYESEGNVGKTSFAKYCAVHHGACLLASGKTPDIAYALTDDPKNVIFNITRTQEERFNYQALEAIKDGVLFSAKYESKVKIFNPPHVFVFANFAPDRRAMSRDRWRIAQISPSLQLIWEINGG